MPYLNFLQVILNGLATIKQFTVYFHMASG
jgi:hypothetical protein